MFSNAKTSERMDADARNAVTDTGGKRAEVTPAAKVEPGISVRTGISTFYGNLLLFMFEGVDELPNIVTTPCGRLYYGATINGKLNIRRQECSCTCMRPFRVSARIRVVSRAFITIL
jgi:hypothetical protein